MVPEEKLENWVEGKLDNGADPEILKKSLEKEDLDPSIVDKVLKKEKEQQLQSFEKKLGDKEKKSSRSFNVTKPDIQIHPGRKLVNSFPSLSLPRPGKKLKTRVEDVSAPRPDRKLFNLGKNTLNSFTETVRKGCGKVTDTLGLRKTVFALTLLLLAGVSGMALTSCHEGDVSINSVSTPGDTTVVDVSVEGSTLMVLEVFDSDGKTGSTYSYISGKDTLEIDAQGPRLVFRPVGCDENTDSVFLQ